MSPYRWRVLRVVIPVLVVVSAALALWWGTRDATGGVNTYEGDLRELALALAAEAQRPVEGRMSAFTRHRPVAPVTRGASSILLSPDARVAAARIEKAASEHPTPQHLAAFGVALTVAGRWNAGVEALERATGQRPESPAFLSDLSAAYVARGRALEQPDDFVRALDAATRAVRLDPMLPGARFNRALSLRFLSLTAPASDAWSAALRLERDHDWATEIRDHLVADSSAADRAAPTFDGQAAREYVEDALLAQWGEAISRGDRERAEQLLTSAEQAARALASGGGDQMPEDEVRLIRRYQRTGDRAAVRRLGEGHPLYASARRALANDRLDEAAATMAQAAHAFKLSGSPYQHWLPMYEAFALRFQQKADLGLRRLQQAPLERLPEAYHHLRGRLAWAEGVLQGALGRFDLEPAHLRLAVREFEMGHEQDYELAARTILAETEWYLGRHQQAWAEVVHSFQLFAAQGRSTRDYQFGIAAVMAIGTDLPYAALDLLDERARVAANPRAVAEAKVRRARLLTSMGDSAAAGRDLEAAAEAIDRVPQGGPRTRVAADLQIARSEWFSRTDCPRAIAHADAAYDELSKIPRSIRTVSLLAVRARCRVSLGDLAGARLDLDRAAAVFETRRAEFSTNADRIQAFERERESFKALIRLEAVDLGDEAGALRTAERAREGVLPPTAISPETLVGASALPASVGVIYFESLEDRLLTWVMTRHGRRLMTLPVPSRALHEMVVAVRRSIDAGANLAQVASSSRPLYDAVIGPAIRGLDTMAPGDAPSTIYVVPDGPLFLVPFAALPDHAGQPLLRTRTIGVAPSLAGFFDASARLRDFTPQDVLAIGDGHDAQLDGLPRLPGADPEVDAVARAYPRSQVLKNATATKARVLRRPHDVVHFAGHTIVNPLYPMFSRLLLAPDPETGDSGALTGEEITPRYFGRTRLVVLASCDGAAGRLVDGEGALSVARTFFTAGVPAVIASLWPVPDGLPGFAETLHATLVADHSPALALRMAQLRTLDRLGPAAPVSAWGGFITFGGTTTIP